jgi:hypothetical protein
MQVLQEHSPATRAVAQEKRRDFSLRSPPTAAGTSVCLF